MIKSDLSKDEIYIIRDWIDFSKQIECNRLAKNWWCLMSGPIAYRARRCEAWTPRCPSCRRNGPARTGWTPRGRGTASPICNERSTAGLKINQSLFRYFCHFVHKCGFHSKHDLQESWLRFFYIFAAAYNQKWKIFPIHTFSLLALSKWADRTNINVSWLSSQLYVLM